MTNFISILTPKIFGDFLIHAHPNTPHTLTLEHTHSHIDTHTHTHTHTHTVYVTYMCEGVRVAKSMPGVAVVMKGVRL